MAVIPKEFGNRAGSARTWTLEASGDLIESYGYDLTIAVDVDTANTDTVTVLGSLDGESYYTIKSYTADTLESIPNVPYLKMECSSADSKVFVYGVRPNG